MIYEGRETVEAEIKWLKLDSPRQGIIIEFTPMFSNSEQPSTHFFCKTYKQYDSVIDMLDKYPPGRATFRIFNYE